MAILEYVAALRVLAAIVLERIAMFAEAHDHIASELARFSDPLARLNKALQMGNVIGLAAMQ
jgi:hypothetical protein